MKKYLLLGCFLLAGVSYASPFEGESPTTCQILKNGKMIKKSSCIYSGYMDEQDMSLSYSFDVKGYSEVTTDMLRTSNGKNGEMRFNFKMNEKPAVPVLRDSKTLKVAKAPKGLMYADNQLSCMQQTKTKLEICMPAKDAFLSGQ